MVTHDWVCWLGLVSRQWKRDGLRFFFFFLIWFFCFLIDEEKKNRGLGREKEEETAGRSEGERKEETKGWSVSQPAHLGWLRKPPQATGWLAGYLVAWGWRHGHFCGQGWLVARGGGLTLTLFCVMVFCSHIKFVHFSWNTDVSCDDWWAKNSCFLPQPYSTSSLT